MIFLCFSFSLSLFYGLLSQKLYYKFVKCNFNKLPEEVLLLTIGYNMTTMCGNEYTCVCVCVFMVRPQIEIYISKPHWHTHTQTSRRKIKNIQNDIGWLSLLNLYRDVWITHTRSSVNFRSFI